MPAQQSSKEKGPGCQEGGDFQTIFYRLPPPGAGSAALEGHEAFESRNLTSEKIMVTM